MERLRRTMMFVPGANAAMLRDAPLFGADSVMFDLEDSVSLKEKDTSRALVHFALKTFDYSSVETVVRVNGLDSCGALDIEAVVLAGVNVIRLPKQRLPKILLMWKLLLNVSNAKTALKLVAHA